MNLIIFALSIAWLYVTWPIRLLWLKWRSRQAHLETVDYINTLIDRQYYHEDK